MHQIELWQSTYMIMVMWIGTSILVVGCADNILKRVKRLEERLKDNQVIR